MSDLARDLISAEIKGELNKAVHEDERHLLSRASAVLELRHGPVSSVQSVTVSGDLLDPDEYRLTSFGLERQGGYVWPAGCTIFVSYTSGWDAGLEPVRIKQALTLTDQWLESDPHLGITEYRGGDESVKRQLPAAQVPDAAAKLVAPWRRP